MRCAVLAAALAGCAGATSGEPHPGPPPQSHTVDATGSADNAGRTSDEVARPETAGVRPTELGGDRPTGTNTGLPTGARTRTTSAPSPPPRRALVMPREGDSPVAGYADEPGTVGAELCDREAACGRVGAGRSFETKRACSDALRPRVQSDLGAMGCKIDPDALATCLARIHATPCAEALDRLGAVPECGAAEMCAGR
jgi:hypothetical protein